MPYTTELQGCTGTATKRAGSGLLPVSPFYTPRYHFGMLLGVDDFEAEQAYHRGKVRLHNAWLHGEGVVWGLRVDAPRVEEGDGSLTGEVRVRAGLALDAAGRELFLPQTACVSLSAWYQIHEEDPGLRAIVEVGDDGAITFDAHVVARFRACLSRPVPAISEPCDGATSDTAFSRAQETVELLLLPGLSQPRSEPYHRLRLLFGIAEPRTDEDSAVVSSDQQVLDARAGILALPSDDQPSAYLRAFRRFAALDEMDVRPARRGEGEATHFPETDETVVVLADVQGITLRPDGDDGLTLDDVEIDNTVRSTHVATATLQELLCGPLMSTDASAAEVDDDDIDPGPPDAGGPRVRTDSVELEGEAVTFRCDKPLSKASVAREAFSISAYDNRDGWREVEIARDPKLDRGAKRVRIELSSGFGGNLVRVIARGTGPAPLMGTNLIPLAGAVDGPAGGHHNGHDFVLMLKRSEL